MAKETDAVVGAPMAVVMPIPAERFEIGRDQNNAPVLVVPNDRQVIKLHDAVTSYEKVLAAP